MTSLTDYLTLQIPDRLGFLNITPRVESAVSRSGVREGIVLVNPKQPK